MPEPIMRSEYNESIGRLHDRVNEIKDSVIRTEESVKHSESFMKDMHKVLYGDNGKDGFIITTKIQMTRLFERISLHTKIIITAILAIITGFVGMIINFYRPK